MTSIYHPSELKHYAIVVAPFAESPIPDELLKSTRYLCNQAVKVTESKCVEKLSDVTCKNCLRMINKGQYPE